MKSRASKNAYGKVGVLAGGPSSEREISLRSGKAVHAALLAKGLDAVFVDMRDDIREVLSRNRMDVAFIALHGRFGEDGTVQAALEEAGIPYTGSGPVASRRALDKVAAKNIFFQNCIPTPHYMVYERGVSNAEDVAALGFPIVVKPQFEGSSMGLGIVRERAELDGAIDRALAFDRFLLVEEFIDGRELTVGILDDEPLPVVEIVPKSRVYDFAAKYSDPDTKYLAPAPLDKKTAAAAQELAVRAHRSIECASLSRVDMMLDAAGDLFLLEVNTIPGMTERSLLPKAAAVRGIDFGELCMTLIRNAIDHGKTKT